MRGSFDSGHAKSRRLPNCKIANFQSSHRPRKMKTALLLTLLVLLSAGAAHTRPARRSRTDAEDIISSNESGSRYILDVFKSLSNDSIPTPLRTQANTIRSLPNIAAGCNMFNFSLSEVDNAELPIKSDLFLYMVRQEDTNERLTIEIRKVIEEPDADDFITSMEIVHQRESGWLEFHLTPYLAELIPAGKTHAAFRVIIKGPGLEVLDCKNSPITFSISRDVEKDKAPYLSLFTFDNRILDVDYNTVLKNLAGDSTATSNTEGRKRRSVDKPLACQLNSLVVNSIEIPKPPIPRLSDATVVLPLTVDLGICGGACSLTAPKHDQLRHSILAHHFLSQKGFQHEGNPIKKCCAPVEYGIKTFVFQKNNDNKEVFIITLANMQIVKCDCLDIIDFTIEQT